VLVNRTSSRDLATKTICATVDSLSPFVVAEEIDDTLPLISGIVIDSNDEPLVGIPVALTGTESRQTATDSSGAFAFPNLTPNGNYNVRPSKVGFLFEQDSDTFVDLEDEATGVFIGDPATFSISGRVVDINDNGISGVEISAEGDGFGTALTDVDGNFTITGLPADGAFKVTAFKQFLSVQPDALEVEPLAGDVTGVEFTAFVPTSAAVSISGRVLTSSGVGLRNASLTLSESSSGVRKEIRTSSFGYYNFEGLEAGKTYVLEVRARGYTFKAPVRMVTAVDSISDLDFVAVAPF
jgi:hypothetical protein